MKATFNLPNGTIVTVEGSKQDVETIMESVSTMSFARQTNVEEPASVEKPEEDKHPLFPPDVAKKLEPPPPRPPKSELDSAAIAEFARQNPHVEALQSNILDKRDQLMRAMLPLYLMSTHIDPESTLDARQISEILDHLKVSMASTNISKVFRTDAGKYVVKARSGKSNRYRLTDAGCAAISELLERQPEQTLL